MSAPTAEDTDTTDATDDLVPWDGTLIQEDTPTGDNRRIDPEALQWDTPLTLRYVRQDMGEHDGAEAIGRIDEVWRDGNDIRGRGVIDAGTETGAYAVRQIEQGIMTGVSADLDDVAFEIRDEGNQPAADEDAEMELMMTGEGVMATTSARIRAATLVQIPAFSEATLQLSEPTDDDEGDEDDDEEEEFAGDTDTAGTRSRVSSNTAGGGEGLQTTSSAQHSGSTHHATVTAASQPTTPPSAWFADPGLHEPSPLAVTEDGYVYGHLASWGVCHASEPAGPGTCVTAPSSETGYSRFHTGTLVTSDNRTISVGKVTMGTNHAPSTSNPKATAAHYDHTGTAVADVRAGEDAHGIWVAGALRPEVTDEQIRALRASPLSGDWRKVDGNLELHAALAVNVPGFPIPRPAGMVSSGELSTIVASGMVAPRTVRKRSASGDTLTDEDLAYLKKLADRERSNERTALAQRVQDSRTAVNRRRVESFATKRKG